MTDLLVGGTENSKRIITLYEICKVLDKRHSEWKTRVEEMHKMAGFGEVRQKSTSNSNNVSIVTYNYTEKQSLMIGARLDPNKIILLVNEIEKLKQQEKPLLPTTYREALQQLIEKDIQLEEAVKTKAYISDKKTATAMATASIKSKENEKLKQELDQSKNYCTVKRMQMLNHGLKFKWKLLKDTSIEMDIKSIDIFDANYGTVKGYHKDVWYETYKLTF